MSKQLQGTPAEAPKGAVQVDGGQEWRKEVDRRISEGRERLAGWNCPVFRSYAQRVLNGSTPELAGYTVSDTSTR